MKQWSDLQTESGVYIVRLDEQSIENREESTFTIWVSDFKTLWNETLTRQDIIERFAQKNSNIANGINNDDVIKSQLISALATVANMKNPSIDSEPQSDNDNGLKLQLKYVIFDDQEVDFQWQLKKCGAQEFFEQFTKSLLRQVGELQDQKKEFVDGMKRKDDEIDQYKLEVGPIEIRKRFITEKFVEQKYELQCQTFTCEIDKFESVIGLLPKNVASDKSKATEDESCSVAEQPSQNSSVVKQKSPRGKRNPRKLFAPVIRPGDIKYEDDSDDGGDNNNSNNSASNKRTRQSF